MNQRAVARLCAACLGFALISACSPTPAMPLALPPTATASPLSSTSAPVAPHILVVTPQSEAGQLSTLATASPDVELPPSAGTTWTSSIDSATLVFVAGGEFNMGTTDDEPAAEPDEFPLHRVLLSPFWIDQNEVTNRQYAQCVEAGACIAPPSAFSAEFDLEYFGSEEYADYPVVNVTWGQAQTYCAWAGRRLPTEAEWEKAARGRPGKTFPWGWFGQVTNDRLNYCDAQCPYVWHDTERDDGYRLTSPVGAFPKGASPYGALDMAGNVWEWVADWYGPKYYASSPTEDPSGPEMGSLRVLRGGSWLDGVLAKRFAFARTANRYGYDPELWRSYIGFRCASDVGE